MKGATKFTCPERVRIRVQVRIRVRVRVRVRVRDRVHSPWGTAALVASKTTHTA